MCAAASIFSQNYNVDHGKALSIVSKVFFFYSKMSLKELQYSGDHGSGILRVSYTLVFLLDQELSSSPCHEVIDHPSPQGREHGEEIGDCPEYPTREAAHSRGVGREGPMEGWGAQSMCAH